MPRPKVHDDALRLRLLDEAGRLLSTEGPGALSLRRLASDVGTSTTAVYSLFGGKPELVRALFIEAFARFGRRLAAVSHTDDPLFDLLQLGVVYRESALADPHLYSIMFAHPVPEFEPDQEAALQSRSTMEPLLDAVRRGVEAGALRAEKPELIGFSLWATVHGLVSLELAGCAPEDVGADYRRSLQAAVAGWLN